MRLTTLGNYYKLYIGMRSRIITLSVPAGFLREVDAAAARERRARSELFREAVRQYLRSEMRWQQIRAWGRETARRLKIRSEEDVYRHMETYRHGTRETKTSRRSRRRS